MSETIVIGMPNEFSANTNKWLFSITGLFFLINGTMFIYENILKPFGMVLGVLELVGGLYYIFYGLFGFLENSKFAPKLKIDESIIELKNSVWKPSKRLNWSDVSSIKFQSFEVIFQLKNSTSTFSYNSNADVSITIKQTIRKFAERKKIEIIGG